MNIGVYVCHCGTNIAGVIDVEKVTEYAATLNGVVVARNYKYMCSDPGKELIRSDIKEKNLDRVVVAACSPTMHEKTYRDVMEEMGGNPFLFEMANIREQDSWVHTDKDMATEKAYDLVRMAVAKVRRNEPLERIEIPVTQRALIIGGGVAGMEASLDLAEQGYEVIMVEKEQSIGGHMSQLTKTFPTLDCPMCILAPKMALHEHKNITIYSFSELEEVSGYVGNFEVAIRKKAKSVIEDLCNGCGLCQEKCPTKVLSVYDGKLGMRKAIYTLFPQAVPRIPVLDRENCLMFTKGTCGVCKKVCPTDAIDYDQQDEIITEKVGAIIVATGYAEYDPTPIEEYGYGRYKNVLTGLQFERLTNASGPTLGALKRPSDGATPKRFAFIQCVGSRDVNTHEYCSKVCCMYTVKNARLLRDEHPESEVYIFYTDVRSAGKGYEEFYKISQEKGVKFIRGRVSEIVGLPDDNLLLRTEDTLTGDVYEVEVDMAILACALLPAEGSDKLRDILKISEGTDGFFMEAHPKLRPVDTLTDGVYLAGCAQGPRDIADTVVHAKGAASGVSVLISHTRMSLDPISAYSDESVCRGCGECKLVCQFGAIEIEPLNGRLIAKVNEVLCKGCGACVGACCNGAMSIRHFKDEQINSMIEAAMEVA